MGDGGVADCGKAQNCVEVCPKEIPLVDSIAGGLAAGDEAHALRLAPQVTERYASEHVERDVHRLRDRLRRVPRRRGDRLLRGSEHARYEARSRTGAAGPPERAAPTPAARAVAAPAGRAAPAAPARAEPAAPAAPAPAGPRRPRSASRPSTCIGDAGSPALRALERDRDLLRQRGDQRRRDCRRARRVRQMRGECTERVPGLAGACRPR